MDFSFIEIKTLLLIVHLFGIAFGAGGAFISDLLFFKAIADRKLTKSEMGFLTLGSHAVTGGLILLILSGAAMFSLDPERYLASSKFMAKMTVVAILTANGFFFHLVHLPRLKRQSESRTALPHDARYRLLMLASGVVSLVSWASAIVLGAFRAIPWSYVTIIGVYLAALGVGLVVAYVMRDRLMPSLQRAGKR